MNVRTVIWTILPRKKGVFGNSHEESPGNEEEVAVRRLRWRLRKIDPDIRSVWVVGSPCH